MGHVITAALIKNGDRYLMVQEKLEKCYGQWNWPAGWVDAGETPEQAAIREVKEEVGLDVTISKKLGEWHDNEAGRTRILYLADNVSGKLAIQESEILGAAWLNKDQMIALRDSMRVQDWTCDFVGQEENE